MTSTPRTVAQKMGVRPGGRTDGVSPGVLETLGMPPLQIVRRLGEQHRSALDHVHLFVRTRAELEAALPRLVPYVARQGKLWVSWPKGGRLGTDLGLPVVIAVGYDHEMVESTNLRIDDTWTALKFTHPKPGKVYANSHGTLPSQR